MLFRFRIYHDPQLADQAQGWVIADSEVSARKIIGEGEIQLEQISFASVDGAPNGTVFITEGSL